MGVEELYEVPSYAALAPVMPMILAPWRVVNPCLTVRLLPSSLPTCRRATTWRAHASTTSSRRKVGVLDNGEVVRVVHGKVNRSLRSPLPARSLRISRNAGAGAAASRSRRWRVSRVATRTPCAAGAATEDRGRCARCTGSRLRYALVAMSDGAAGCGPGACRDWCGAQGTGPGGVCGGGVAARLASGCNRGTGCRGAGGWSGVKGRRPE